MHVDVGIADFAITDDQEDSIGRRVVDEAMAVADGRKADAHPARENLLSGIGFKCDLAFEHVDELICREWACR